MTFQSMDHFFIGDSNSDQERTNHHTNLLDTAFQLTQSGISVIATGADKIPVGGRWGPFQKRIATLDELSRMFNYHKATGIASIGGRVSGNLYHVDFEGKDYQGQPMGCIYPQWAELAKPALEHRGYDGLFDALVITKTQNAGVHARWRVETDLNLKTEALAKSHVLDLETGEVLTDERGKPITNLLIESKAEGGCCLSPPSLGYELVQGDLCNIPTIPLEIHRLLISIAKSFHAVPNDVESHTESRRTTVETNQIRPGDEFNQRGDHLPLLKEAGWVLVHVRDSVEYWRRPGKDENWSATWGHIPDRLYVFSSNASPFEENRTYDKFSIYTYFKHSGDFEAAARDLASQGFGAQNGSPRTSQSTSDESSQAVDEGKTFDEISSQIEEAAEITDRRERNQRIKAIIDRLVDLAPIDQSMFIEQMKDLKLGSKGTLSAQLKEAIKAKKQSFSSLFAPSDDNEARFAHGIYEGNCTYDRLEYNKALGGFHKRPITSFLSVPTELVKVNGYDVFRVDFVTEHRQIEGAVLHRRDFNDRKRFKDALKSSALQFLGTDNDLQGILGILSQYDVPLREGTPKIGLYNHGDESIWLTDDGAFTGDGFIDNPKIVYMPDGGRGVLDGKFVYHELSDNDYRDFLFIVSEKLFSLNLTDAIIPIVGWFASAYEFFS